MAVSGPWVGSSGVSETGERWGQNIARKLRITGAHWVSSWRGRSWELTVNYTSSNHNFNTNNMHNDMKNAAGGSWPSSAMNPRWRIKVHPGVQLVSFNTANACMWFGGSIAGQVTIENHGWIWGRGGNAGRVTAGSDSAAENGSHGGPAITREGHITLAIDNRGIISGGGGGGGAAYTFSSAGGGRNYGMGGGGGRPFGAAGTTSGMNHPRPGGAATINGPGSGGRGGDNNESYGGNGGDIAIKGGNGSGNRASRTGGNPGAAISGSGPINYINKGDIRGSIS